MEEYNEEDEIMEFLREAQEEDLGNLRHAMNKLIDPLTKFMGIEEKAEGVEPQDLLDLLESLAYAEFVVHGLMYSYGFGIECTHDHDEEDDE